MAQDAELERLRSDQQRAFQRKQDAWQTQDQSWKAYQSAQDALQPVRERTRSAYAAQEAAWQQRQAIQAELDGAYSLQRPAYERQQAAWVELRDLRATYGPRISDLKAEHDAMFERIKSLSQDIENAFSWGSKDDAFHMIEEVKGLRSDIRELPPRWREWSDMIRRAKEVHATAAEEFRPLQAEVVLLKELVDTAKREHWTLRDEFKAAKDERDRLQAARDDAKAEHERLSDAYREAKAEAERAMEAFQTRLEQLKREAEQRKDDKRSLAQIAGVPAQYWDDVYMSTDDGGNINIYFGGIGEPNGPGHGHYVMDQFHNVTYARDPDQEHGAHNFTEVRERQRERKERNVFREQIPQRPPKRDKSSKSQQRRNAAQRASGWQPRASEPPDAGVLDSTDGGLDNIVSFKTGGPTGDQTLIRDGDYSDDRDGFDGLPGDRHHNHYGSRQEDDGWIDQDRGYYTGPDH